MLREAAGRYVALDGRMWRTLIGLFFRPGFLSREYFAGRRRRYIRPARLFLVLSIALFALLRFAGEPPVAAGTGRTDLCRDAALRALRGVRAAAAVRVAHEAGLVGRARSYPLRPRRYAAHLVFGAYNHAFLFLVGLLLVLPIAPLRAALIIWAIVYLLWSMKTVYGGRWSGVLARALVIVFAYSVFFAVVIGGLAVAAIMLR